MCLVPIPRPVTVPLPMLLRFITALIGSLVIRAAALDALRPRLDSANHDPASQAACLTALRGDFAPTGQAPLAPLDPEKIATSKPPMSKSAYSGRSN